MSALQPRNQGEVALPPRSVAAPGGDIGQALERFMSRVSNVWLPALSWSIGRTGRAGLVGIALLAASALFYVSTHLPVADEVQQLQSDVDAARARAAKTPRIVAVDPLAALRDVPTRTQIPAMLGLLLKQADDAKLSIDTAKYEISTTKAGALVRYKISFPIDGPYPKVRQFIDAALTAMPALAIEDLSITRKSIADEEIEAQLRMTIFAREDGP